MNRFIKIICRTKEEADFIHKQLCIVNEKKCNGKYECRSCQYCTVNIEFEIEQKQ